MVCIRERLYIPMISDSDCFMSPFHGTFYDIFYLGNTIHIAHLGMAVKLDSLLRTGVHPHAPEIRYLFDSDNRTYRKFTIEFIDCRNTFNL